MHPGVIRVTTSPTDRSQAADGPVSIGPLTKSRLSRLNRNGGIMRQARRISISQAAAVGAMSAIFLIAGAAQASDRKGSLTEEFHKVYPLSAQGRIQIENL